MKLTDENRIEIYRLKKGGYTYKELSKKFEIDPSENDKIRMYSFDKIKMYK